MSRWREREEEAGRQGGKVWREREEEAGGQGVRCRRCVRLMRVRIKIKK